MNKELVKYLIYVTITIISLYLISCGKLTAPSKDAPTDLKVEKIEEGRVKLTWIYLDTSDDTIVFVIAKKEGEGNWNENYEVVSGQTRFLEDDIFTCDSLVYAYKVKANNLSTGEFSQFSKVVAYLSSQTTPTDLSITQITQELLKISWKDHCVGEDGYYVDKKLDAGNWINKYKILSLNSDSFQDNTTLFDTVYFRVYAFAGISKSEAVSNYTFTTLPAPSNLTLQKPDDNKIKISWIDNSDGEEGFYIDKKIGGLDWVIEYSTVDSNVTNWIDDITQPCGTFYYRVRAFYNEFYSDYSNEEHTNIRLELVDSLNTLGDANEVFVSNSGWYAFVADGYNGLVVIDCINPTLPNEITTMDLPDRTLSVFVQDNLAYVTNHNGGFNLVDISIINSPEVIGSCVTEGMPNDVFVYGDHAYVADGAAGLSVIITAGPPHFETNISTNGDARKVFLKENYDYAFIANGLNGGITIIDISDPLNPISVSNLPINGLSQDVYVLGNYAYLANGENGLEIIDISDPTNPFTVSNCPTDGFAYSVYAQEHYVYLVDKYKGLIVIFIEDPFSPYILGTLEMLTEPVSIYISGSYAFLTDNEGLKIIQVAP
ncbi:MAG: hypothetical protein KAW92_01305 [Candidatus Cloacimonetes bacterium]|nr:hypothetical protein [Candidatus Cloacimonadota bacterium]